jgi:hypothetical protein
MQRSHKIYGSRAKQLHRKKAKVREEEGKLENSALSGFVDGRSRGSLLLTATKNDFVLAH